MNKKNNNKNYCINIKNINNASHIKHFIKSAIANVSKKIDTQNIQYYSLYGMYVY